MVETGLCETTVKSSLGNYQAQIVVPFLLDYLATSNLSFRSHQIVEKNEQASERENRLMGGKVTRVLAARHVCVTLTSSADNFRARSRVRFARASLSGKRDCS